MIIPTSITFRLTVFFSTASTIILLLIGLLVDTLVEAHFEHMDQNELAGKLKLIRHAVENVSSDADITALPAKLNDALVGHNDLFVAIVNTNHQLIFTTANTDFTIEVLKSIEENIASKHSDLKVWRHDKRIYRGKTAYAKSHLPGEPNLLVALAIDIEHHQEFMVEFHRNLWIAIAACIGLTILLGWTAARRGLAPVREMARLTRGVSASHLAARIPQESVPSELIGLATEFNEMLDRLENSFGRLSEFSSNLAHELRTPISNLMTQTQVILSKHRNGEDYREILYSALEEYERLARMISDMLLLAKADNGQIMPDIELVDLAKEVSELFAYYEAVADEKEIKLVLDGQASVRGNKLMLRRALSNLLSNGVRHAHRATEVHVTIKNNPASKETILVIQNSGEKISEKHLPLLFDRFYRVDPSRQKASDGAGLGLAITKSIVEAHQGKIKVSSDDISTQFEVTLMSDTHTADSDLIG